MLHVAVYGSSKWSILMKDLLENKYSNFLTNQGGDSILVDHFCSMNHSDEENVISLSEFATLYAQGDLIAIIIPKEFYMQQNELVLTLLRLGIDVNDIYNGIRLSDSIKTNPAAIQGLITPILEDSYLSYLEFHVADHCNLNCKYCTHYSPLVAKPVFTVFETFQKDLLQLKKHILDIGVIRILGGEPLLNPELPKYIEFVRSVYPGSIITIVTNGLLLDRIDSQLIQTMNDCLAFFHISYYPTLEPKIKKIKEFLCEQGIPFTISPLINQFNKTQTLVKQTDEDFFYSCFQASCTCIHNGKLAPCYAPFTTKYFNEAFSQTLPVDEGVDIYNPNLTLPQLKASLLIPMNRCQYCINGQSYDWEILGKSSNLEDWV